jgi:uncharacterized protein
MKQKIFLSATWEYLAMFNYEVDPTILKTHLPPFTEIDFFEGKALISVVGFLFNNTKVFGVKWPGHAHFDEVNLRYYVKHFDGKKWKRGVGFVSEIVPKPIIAATANFLYNEHYSTATMHHTVLESNDELLVKYNWKKKNQPWNLIEIQAGKILKDIATGSEEEFIFEHYFGYNQLNPRTTIEYAVEHPRWQVYPVTDFLIKCDIKNLYGDTFVPFIDGVKPRSVFLAKGSDVIVRKPVKLKSETCIASSEDIIG